MFGWLNVDKPGGITSRDAVNQIQRIVAPLKVGHAGTLDPLATGVLVIAIGPATRLVPFIQELPKRYRATFRFGWRSDTDDIDGRLEPCPGSTIEQHALELTLEQFVGDQEQIPPDYSAVKVQGRRAYELARQGASVELAARRIQVYSLRLINYTPPDWSVEIACSKGTYVRALGRDIAARLQTCAVMTELRRTAVGPFKAEEAVPLERLRDAQAVAEALLPPAWPLQDWPSVQVNDHQRGALHHGQSIALSTAPSWMDRQVLAFDSSGALVAVLTPECQGKRRPALCFV